MNLSKKKNEVFLKLSSSQESSLVVDLMEAHLPQSLKIIGNGATIKHRDGNNSITIDVRDADNAIISDCIFDSGHSAIGRRNTSNTLKGEITRNRGIKIISHPPGPNAPQLHIEENGYYDSETWVALPEQIIY